MSHVVLSKGTSGEPKVDEVGSLEEALQQVERLRNEDGVSDVRVLREVPIEVKTYYKAVAIEDDAAPERPTPIEMDAAPAGVTKAAPSDPPSGSAVLAPPHTPSAVAAPDLDGPSAERRTTRFGRS